MPEADKKNETRTGNSTLAAIAEVERAIEETRRAALKLFSERRVLDGSTLNEWLTCERENCWPASSCVERDAEYELRIDLPGFDARTVELTGRPHQLVIEARGKKADFQQMDDRGTGPTVCHRRLRKHVDLPVDFRADNARATLHNGVLTVIVPKAGAAADTHARKWRISFSR